MFGSPNVVSIAEICTGELRDAILQSDYIRNETLRRCYEIPSYESKSLKWKNRYYELIQKRLKEELGIN